MYWLRYPTGTNTPFQAYIIFSRPDGPWVKAVQWNSNVDVSVAASVNAGGTWTTNQIGLAAGKLASADINVMLALTGQTLWRVTGGAGTGDQLMNSGAGALKIVFNGVRPAWGTDRQPLAGTETYDMYLDMTNSGTYNYAYHYVPTGQARCNHAPSVWISDHNSPVGAGSGLVSGYPATPPATSNGYTICWTVGATAWYTNLHIWSGTSVISAGSAVWGTQASVAATMFVAN